MCADCKDDLSLDETGSIELRRRVPCPLTGCTVGFILSVNRFSLNSGNFAAFGDAIKAACENMYADTKDDTGEKKNEENADVGKEMLGLNNMLRHTIVAVTMMSLFAASLLWGAEGKPSKPTSKDKCPVCGMFVAKYPDFIAEIVFRDGSVVFFDGAKDMFKYYLNMNKYNPRQKETDIEYVYVTDYYSLTIVDGLKAYYVQGSDVFGPMGRELIPFEKEREAREFMKDHKGKTLLRFQEITASIIKGLD